MLSTISYNLFNSRTVPDKNKKLHNLVKITCDRDRIRTYDRLLRRQMLYPAELRDLTKKPCK